MALGVCGAPTSMQCAIEETGVLRILLAAFIGAIGKLLGREGQIFVVAGREEVLQNEANECSTLHGYGY